MGGGAHAIEPARAREHCATRRTTPRERRGPRRHRSRLARFVGVTGVVAPSTPQRAQETRKWLSSKTKKEGGRAVDAGAPGKPAGERLGVRFGKQVQLDSGSCEAAVVRFRQLN